MAGVMACLWMPLMPSVRFIDDRCNLHADAIGTGTGFTNRAMPTRFVATGGEAIPTVVNGYQHELYPLPSPVTATSVQNLQNLSTLFLYITLWSNTQGTVCIPLLKHRGFRLEKLIKKQGIDAMPIPCFKGQFHYYLIPEITSLVF